MPEVSIRTDFEFAGMPFSGRAILSASGAIGHDPVILPAARAGVLTTRDSGTAGEVTLGEGHGITTGQTVDLYWSGGKRRDVTVGTVDGTAAAVSGGSGDDLPAQDAAIFVAPQLEIDTDFDGDKARLLAIQANGRWQAGFFDAGDNLLVAVSREQTLRLWEWNADTGAPNPLEGEVVDSLRVSQAGTTPLEGRVAILYESTE